MGEGRRPVPRAPRPVQRWFQDGESSYRWEQDGLDHVKSLMPGVEPYRAWATFSFVAPSGRVHQCDLFIATPGGLYLVELKGHPGRVVNSGSTWTFFGPDRPRTIRNPLGLTDWKSKELKARLIWAARECGFGSIRVPRIELPSFSVRPTSSHISTPSREPASTAATTSTPGSARSGTTLGRPPERDPIAADFSKRLPQMLDAIGITHSTAHLRFGDEWRMEPQVLDAYPTWETASPSAATSSTKRDGSGSTWSTSRPPTRQDEP